jgi:hypothetical protein
VWIYDPKVSKFDWDSESIWILTLDCDNYHTLKLPRLYNIYSHPLCTFLHAVGSAGLSDAVLFTFDLSGATGHQREMEVPRKEIHRVFVLHPSEEIVIMASTH